MPVSDRPQPADQVDRTSLEQVLAVNVGALFLGPGGGAPDAPAGYRRGHRHDLLDGQPGAFPGIVSYCISKGGVDLMVKTLAGEWAEHGIRSMAFIRAI